ncbi:hypothetical protein PULV_a0492 [Pseudoalteromonas ulvae UL12]|uniref:Peptidase M56 domain-containing protein n=1 Tax=Pseudoalteromonas ulvae TaxID=107327 RepID=A0A244CU55_PSEDV|nr:M56 family metallopeptidase [Pseudoalteromonas ulvae]MBE0362896.1 hypothetical protein [Pseudoalteromonas ulvae UL12]OUL59135.1 hypothetical protein B1199_02325 [Pseudoalteromonas ulvae]
MEVLTYVLDNRFFQLLAWPLIHFLWQACVIAVLVFASLKLINNRYSKLRYGLSLSALVLCLLSPLATYLVTESQMQVNELVDVQSITVSEAQSSLIPSNYVNTPLTQWLDYAPLLSLFWLIGVCFFSLTLLTQMYRTYQLPKQNTIAPSVELQQLFYKLIQRFNANKHSRLLISMSAEVPMVIGWIKPVVLLPLSMSSGLSIHQVEMLLAHEIAHIKRYDYLVNFLQTLVEVIFFFHPAVHWISKQVRAEREYCCDDVALSCCDNPLAYANTLTQAEMLRPHHIPTLAMAASGGDLKNRIFRVIDHQCTPKNTFKSDALVAVVVLSLLSSAFYNQKSHEHTVNDKALNGKTQNDKPKANTTPLTDPMTNTDTLESQIESLSDVLELTATSSSATTALISTPTIAPTSPPQKIQISHSQSEPTTSPIDTPVTIKTPNALSKPSAISAKSPAVKPTASLATKATSPIEHGTVALTAKPKKAEQEKPTTGALISHAEETTQPQETTTTIQHNTSEPDAFSATPTLANTKQQSAAAAKKTSQTEIAKPQQTNELSATQSLSTVTVNSAPELIHSLPIDTPRAGFRRKERVSVQVTFTVDKQGNVDDFEFENGALAFRKAIKESVREWQFKPAITDGKQVTARVSREFIFTKPDLYDDLPTTGTRIKRY